MTAPRRRIPYLALAILAYAVIVSRELPGGWSRAAYDRLSWLALLIWLVPPAWAVWRRRIDGSSPWLLAGALAGVTLGNLAQMNAIRYLGLACAVAALVTDRAWWRRLLWLATACTWMPAYGHLMHGLHPTTAMIGRILIAIVGAAGMLAGGQQPATAEDDE